MLYKIFTEREIVIVFELWYESINFLNIFIQYLYFFFLALKIFYKIFFYFFNSLLQIMWNLIIFNIKINNKYG